jgi:HD superfamily phosphohydrolase
MRSATAPEAEYHGCHAHEVLGALILKSKSVRAYLAELESKYKIQFRVDDAAGWILGSSSEKDYKYLAQVINGPFDADKLDYLFRDSYFSGLPLSLDLDRLWASCNLATHPTSGETILTLHQSSAVPLEQILFNKINLFTVVYQHPKVRAAECMFQAVIRKIQSNKSYTMAGRRLASAMDFLWVTDSTFFAEALKHRGDHELHKMIHNLLYRRHLVRALTISDELHESKKTAFYELRRLNHNSLEDVDQRANLAREIWEQAGKPCEESDVWLDLPPNPSLGAADNTFVRTPSKTLRKLTDFFPMNYWNESYMSYKWRGHVFCPRHCQQAVYNAAREVLANQFGLKFKKLAGEISHVPNP